MAVDERTFGEKVSEYFVNDGPKLVFVVLWVLANIACFGERVYEYVWVKTEVYALFGEGVWIARGAAAGIKLNAALILMTVLRNFLSFVRGTFLGSYLPIDKNIIFHRYIAWTIAFWSAIHMTAHYFNYLRLSQTTDLARLKALLNANANPDPMTLAWSTLPGATGHILITIMVLIYSASVKRVRGPYFNIFWFSHHLFILFFIINCFHGAAAILEPPTFWMWFVGPGFFYIVERTLRVMRGNQDTILQLAIAHPSRVIELQMRKASFKYKPGQYLFLNCPYIARQEWHPFTISSSPQEDFVSVHIRIVGDWTGDLWKFLNPENKLGVVAESLLTANDGSPIFRIDGPFGAASEEVFNFKNTVLVGGGIGVTPFASILKNVRFKLQETGQTAIQKVYFYWISRDKNAFEWFSDILAALEEENVGNFLEIHTYLTGRFTLEEIKSISHGAARGEDQITGLQSSTHFGRPNWKQIFDGLAEKHKGQEIGVFFCGPSILSKMLYKMCKTHTSSKTQTRFRYHKENF